METQPPVSCICLTYGRPELLEEAIYSFLLQDYAGRKELIVLNDYSGQTLHFDHPEVQVINCPKRFRTLGEKINVAVALAAHDLLFVWDDDDIYLPHRLHFSVEHFEPQKGFFKPDKAWFWTHGELRGPSKNLFHAGSCWSRRLFDGVRGYVAEGTGSDFIFEERLDKHFPGSIEPYAIRPEEIYYIYRWGGTGSYHISGFGRYKAGENVGHDQVESFVQQRVSRGEIRQGSILLQPHWKTDYRQLVSSYIATLAEQQAQGTLP
jgi:glycosyltransferase involved in cell wall biosynthesis